MRKLIILFIPSICIAKMSIISLEDMSLPAAMKKEIRSYHEEMRLNGYVKKDNSYFKTLMHFKNNPPSFNHAKNISREPGDDELKKTPAEIKTTFEFRSNLPNTIAFAGTGHLSDKGWSGIKVIFDGKELGVCAFTVYKSEEIQINNENLRYDINSKPTRIDIESNNKHETIYSVSWFDDNFYKEIECATNHAFKNFNLDHTIETKIIDLAKFANKCC